MVKKNIPNNRLDTFSVLTVAKNLNLTKQAVRYRMKKLNIQAKEKDGILLLDKQQINKIINYGKKSNPTVANDNAQKVKNISFDNDKYVNELITSLNITISALEQNKLELIELYTDKLTLKDELLASQRSEIANLRDQLMEKSKENLHQLELNHALNKANKKLMELLEHEQEIRLRSQTLLINQDKSNENSTSFWKKLFS